MRAALAFALLATLAAGACRSEAQQREDARKATIDSCKSGFATQAPRVSPDRFCDCLARKLVDEKSMDALDAIGRDEAADARMAEQAAAQCGGQTVGSGAAPAGGASAAPEPASEAAE